MLRQKTKRQQRENESDKTDSKKGSVKSLFLDYDGTISPLNVPRSKSEVPGEIREVLRQIRHSTKKLHVK